MRQKLDPGAYREVTAVLLASPLEGEARLVRMIACGHGVVQGRSAKLGDLQVMEYSPRGLLVWGAPGHHTRLWVPSGTTDAEVQGWRAEALGRLVTTTTKRGSHVLLCGGPVRHRWEFPRSGLTLSVVPDGSPRPPHLMAEHPATLIFSFSAPEDHYARATYATRRIEKATLRLNALSNLPCRHQMWGEEGWAWDKSETRSKWIDYSYHSDDSLDENARLSAALAAPTGQFVSDRFYYMEFGASDGVAVTMPVSIDETLAAAEGLPEEHELALDRCSRWILAADRTQKFSRSLAFMGYCCGIEALAREWSSRPKAKDRVEDFMTAMLPYTQVEEAVAQFYKLRGDLGHEGRVFADDHVDQEEDTEHHEQTTLWRIACVCRLAAANWVRARSGLSMLPGI